MIILAGAQSDHNIIRVLDAIKSRQYEHAVIWADRPQDLKFSFDIHSNALDINSSETTPSNISLSDTHSMLIRHDVFTYRDDHHDLSFLSVAERSDLAHAWYTAVKGVAMSTPNIRILNGENNLGSEPNKLRNLRWAQEDGFIVPKTIVSHNWRDFEKDPDHWIIKPIDGGDYTRNLLDIFNQGSDALNKLSYYPWIYQEKLTYPEIRLFQAGKWQFAFEIHNDDIDSRVRNNSMSIREVAVPETLKAPMRCLSHRLGLDYSAADFKTCPQTGHLKFLEINTMPMITGYDNAAGGALSDALALTLHKLQR